MRKYFAIVLMVLFFNSANSQESKNKSDNFGGPLVLLSHSNNGNTLSFGGWGTFIVKNRFQAGIYGVVGTAMISKPSMIKGYESYEIKSRFTGFWLGYYQKFDKYPNFHISYYSRVGFGSVYLDDESNTTVYDKAMQFSPTIEPVFRLNRFLCIGLGIYYDIHTGIDFLQYSNSNFNAIGLNLSIRFCGVD